MQNHMQKPSVQNRNSDSSKIKCYNKLCRTGKSYATTICVEQRLRFQQNHMLQQHSVQNRDSDSSKIICYNNLCRTGTQIPAKSYATTTFCVEQGLRFQQNYMLQQSVQNRDSDSSKIICYNNLCKTGTQIPAKSYATTICVEQGLRFQQNHMLQ